MAEAYTTGHCAHKNAPGGCQLHNLQCGYPECDRKATTPPPMPVDPLEEARAIANRLLIALRRIAYGGGGPDGVFLTAARARAVALEAITSCDGSHLATFATGDDQ